MAYYADDGMDADTEVCLQGQMPDYDDECCQRCGLPSRECICEPPHET